MTPTETAYEIRQEDVDDLMGEVERYLAAVERFRAEGCEPVWADDDALGDWWQLEWGVGVWTTRSSASSPASRRHTLH